MHFQETLRSLFLEGVVGSERVVRFLMFYVFVCLFCYVLVVRIVDHFLPLTGLLSA